MAASTKLKDPARLEVAAGELKGKLAALQAEQETARQAAEQAEAAWRGALADRQLGEGSKAAVAKARSDLDAARENLVSLDGAVAEIGRRLAAAEDGLLAARLAALVLRAEKGAAELGGCVGELLDLDEKAGVIRSRMRAVCSDLLQLRSEHRDLDPEGRSPGEISPLATVLFEGLAKSSSGLNQRGHILLGHLDLAEFVSTWGRGPRVERLLGGGVKGGAQRGKGERGHA